MNETKIWVSLYVPKSTITWPDISWVPTDQRTPFVQYRCGCVGLDGGTLSSHESHSCVFDPAKFNDSLQNVPLVISATVLNVTTDPKDNRLQAATVRVKRIFKGINIINNRKKIVIHGLGNVQVDISLLYLLSKISFFKSIKKEC
ncbi:unnamed protein product [Brugia timori]|uniref:NtA domain-containing protein n=1 Tax=Brugia timori TaxID=42155 RepID=A0A0R3QLV2_9BILA|nr:unnamed protein product [Brugia timori]